MSCLNLIKSSLIAKRMPQSSFESIKKKPDIIIFDYDGTIANNDKHIMKAIKYTIHRNLNKEEIRKTKKFKIDNEYWEFIKHNCSNSIFVECNKDYDNFLSLQKLCKVRGSFQLIKLFAKHNKPMFIVSQKCGESLREDLKKGKIMKYFKNAYGTLDFDDLLLICLLFFLYN